MLLLALALAGQAPDLPSNTAEAARICAAAAMKGPGTPADQVALNGYFVLVATRETRGNKRVGEHIADESQIVFAMADKVDPAILGACKTRFPKAFGRVTLPADSFDRRIACNVASGFLVGSFEHLGDEALSARYKEINERIVNLIADDEFTTHGINTEEQAITVADRWLGAIADLGNPIAVVDACVAAYPG